MKRVLMILGAFLIVAGLAFAQTDPSVPVIPDETASADSTKMIQGTGTIDKIDPKTKTITIRDYKVSTNPKSAELTPETTTDSTNKEEATKGETRVFNYNEQTSFVSSNPEAVDGRMSDLKVDDVVRIQFDDQNVILRIEEVTAPTAQQ